MFDMLDRSVRLSNPSALERVPFMFQTPLEAQHNISARGLDAYLKSDRTLADKKRLGQVFIVVATCAFAVAAWKKFWKWSRKTGASAVLAGLGVHRFVEPESEGAAEAITDTMLDAAKNAVLQNSAFGRYAVDLGEWAANDITGEGYNWNRHVFSNPVLDVLQEGGETFVSGSKFVFRDVADLDNFVKGAVTPDDKAFNKQLSERIRNDFTHWMKGMAGFGAKVLGAPVLAPYQEFVAPFLKETKIPIIRELTSGDVDNPTKYSMRVWKLYEARKELSRKSTRTRLTQNEDMVLNRLNSFVSKADKIAELAKHESSQQMRSQLFKIFEFNMAFMEELVSDEQSN